MTPRRYAVAVVGTGVMGSNLARNLAAHGHAVLVYSRRPETARQLAASHPESAFGVATSFDELVGMLERPRRVLLLVPAGEPVDQVLAALGPLLERDDVVIDCGNSHFVDTARRLAHASEQPWRLIGMGVSGGGEGALRGPSLMPGGDLETWPLLRPLLESIAARSEAGPCVAWCGRGAAGHFVKMVHNGIEYGDMQLLAETATLLREGLGLDSERVADCFATWNAGELESFLTAITAEIFRTRDPDGAGAEILLDAIEDRAAQKGTGRWTVEAALELGVAVPSISAAVEARSLSADKALRLRAHAAAVPPRRRLEGVHVDALGDALYAARIATYAQGFALLGVASEARGYGTDVAEVARIWKAGCIIRARVLDRFRQALTDGCDPRLLVIHAALREVLAPRMSAWRSVVAAAARAGFAVPVHGAALAWLEGLTTSRGSGALIQAQRDYFGSHGYERTDQPGVVVHSDWQALRRGS